MPYPRHGEICGQVYYLLRRYLEQQPIGRVIRKDSGVVTARNPDTVRGADVAFYSYEDHPQGPLPQGYLAVVPRLIFEVFSPTDRWARLLITVGEYLTAGVRVVCVLDESEQLACVYRDDRPEKILTADEELTFPDILPGFGVKVSRFFAA